MIGEAQKSIDICLSKYHISGPKPSLKTMNICSKSHTSPAFLIDELWRTVWPKTGWMILECRIGFRKRIGIDMNPSDAPACKNKAIQLP